MKSTSRLKLAASAVALVRSLSTPGSPGIAERAQAVPRLVRATVSGSYAGTSLGRLALVAGAAAYIASPVDLLPESVLPTLGLADDAVVMAWAVRALVEETDRFLEWEQAHGAPAAPRADRDTTGAGADVDRGAAMRQAAASYVLESVRRRLER